MDRHNRRHQTQTVSRTRYIGTTPRNNDYVRREVANFSHQVTIDSQVKQKKASEPTASQPLVQKRRYRSSWLIKQFVHSVKQEVRRDKLSAGAGVIAAVLVAVSSLAPLMGELVTSNNYDLANAKGLIGSTPTDLKSKLQFDGSKQAWVFNKDAAQQLPGTGADAAKVGGVTYSANLPTRLSKANKLTLSDAQRKLDIAMTPQFSTGAGKAVNGHVVYPMTGRSQLVYTFKDDGIKEDIVLYQAPKSDEAEYSYNLELPSGMEARLEKDGSVGIYGGDPTLFANISYGSDTDKVLIDKARDNSAKTHLYYAIPAPTIAGSAAGSVKAAFELDGTTLTVRASGLTKAHYPLSVDPSFVMDTSGCGWRQSNRESNVDVSSCSLKRSSVSGGTIGNWTASTSLATGNLPATGVTAFVAYNGYLYAFGSGQSTFYQSVYYAPINASTGALGQFVATTSTLDDRRGSFGMVINGYLYAFGGININKTVEFAKINSDGSVGAWTYTSSTSYGHSGGGAAFYNGRVYLWSGCNSMLLACTGQTAVAEYATVRGDGTLSGWTASTSAADGQYPDPTIWLGYGMSNGYLYSMGGQTSDLTVRYSRIKSDGSMGAWMSTGISLPIFNRGLSVNISNGYLYVMGGNSNGGAATTTNTVYLAKIYSNGKIGPFQQTTSFTTARTILISTVYNGRIYISGGQDNFGTGSTEYADTQYATISTTRGDMSSFTTSGNNMGTAVSSGNSVVAYGGYLYVVAGSAGGSISATVQKAAISSNGSVGTWSTAGTLALDRYGAAAVAYNGYLYVMGGQRNTSSGTACTTNGGSSIYCKDVVYAAISPVDGTLGSWLSGGTYSAGGRSSLGAVVVQGYLYVIGGVYGSNSSLSGEVDYAQLNNDGTVGTWNTSTTSITTARGAFGIASSGRYIYLVGGRCASSDCSDTEYAQVPAAGGDITSWNNAGPAFTTARRGMATGVSNGYLYIAGGGNGLTGTNNVYNDVQYAPICDGVTAGNGCSAGGGNAGKIGNWTTSAVTVADNVYVGGAMYNGFMYMAGGCTTPPLVGNESACSISNAIGTVSYAQLYNSGGGADGDWASLGTLPNALGGNMAVAANGYLYSMGGCSNYQTVIIAMCTNISSTVNYAPINADGTIGSWTSTSAMVDPNYLGAAVTYGGRIYVMGGCRVANSTVCGGYSNGVQFATICTGVNLPISGCTGAGAVSSWQYTYNNTTAASYTSGNGFNGAERWYLSAAVRNDGYVYIAGGANGGTTVTDASQLQYAKINANGTMGAWTNANLYTNSRVAAGIAVYNDYLYIAGGGSAVGSGTGYGDVQYADLGSTGAVGTWQATTSLNMPIGVFNIAASEGYMYIWNGLNGSSGTDYVRSDLQYAPIFSNGRLGNWVAGKGYGNVASAVGHWGGGGALYNGYMYSLGGFKYYASDAAKIRQDNAAYYAPIQTQSQIGRYSMQFSTNSQTMPANFFTVTNKQSAKSSLVTIGFTSATTAAPTYGAQQTISEPVTATKNTLTITGSGANYYWLPIILDDTQSFAFGESSQSSIDYFQLNYHPNAGMRLRGGKTFNNSVQQSLDAQ